MFDTFYQCMQRVLVAVLSTDFKISQHLLGVRYVQWSILEWLDIKLCYAVATTMSSDIDSMRNINHQHTSPILILA